MNLPEGQLLRRRVLENVRTVLTTALDQDLTGYARLEPQETLLLDTDGVGVITFEDGVPVTAFHTGTDAAGTDALRDIASNGPYRLELYHLDADVIEQIHESEQLRVPPGMPAKQLTGESDLIERTRDRAPAERIDPQSSTEQQLDAVEAFLDDGSTIESIREQARNEAASRADEWNFPTENDQ